MLPSRWTAYVVFSAFIGYRNNLLQSEDCDWPPDDDDDQSCAISHVQLIQHQNNKHGSPHLLFSWMNIDADRVKKLFRTCVETHDMAIIIHRNTERISYGFTKRMLFIKIGENSK